MKKTISLLTFLSTMAIVSACSKRSVPAVPDHDVIVDRTISMITKYDEILAADDVKEADEDTVQNLANNIFLYINQKPLPYSKTIGIEMKEDGSFLGFEDGNKDNIKTVGERKLFTMEVDVENKRIVYTDETGNHHGYRLNGTGFFLGAMWANMGGRQARAGISPGRFANSTMNTKDYTPRKLNAAGSSRSRTSRASSRPSSKANSSAKTDTRSSARSRARSGGVRSGK